MPNNNRNVARANRNIQNIAKGINDNMDSLYRSTYMTTPQQRDDLSSLNDRINSSIDKIVDRNMDMVGMPSVTKLYSRIAGDNSNSSSSNKVVNELEKMFDNGLVTDDLYGLFMSNRYLRELDNEIDTVCKYMPELEEALAVQRDCVLSADHFSKDFLSFQAPTDGNDSLFSERAKDIKTKYNLAALIEEIYEETSKYGEKFIYRVPYSTAIGKLLSTKPDVSIVAPTRGLHESYDDIENLTESYRISMDSKSFSINSIDGYKVADGVPTVVTESVSKTPDGKDVTKQTSSPILKEGQRFSINLELCKSGIIESAVLSHRNAVQKKSLYESMSIVSPITETDKKSIEAKGNINLDDKSKDKRILANDGLVSGTDAKPVKVNSPGCVVKKLPRDQVIPIYIDDICMGYYFFELRTTDTSESFMGFKNILGDPLTNMRNLNGRGAFNTVDNERQDDTIKYIAGQLSSFIDKQFVNNNQDLAKEIYMILKYNDLFNTPSIDTIKVTFVPPEDMVHFFFKQDPITHRGISDLEKGLIPAKIYSSLYVTSSIGTLTRGQDKRVYYVKQAVDTNIAGTLLNTIAQIKQSNFGIRQFQNINNILNITGRFNDFVIPTNASGDPPIQFEIMPGQDIRTPTELMEQLKEAAINSTGVPFEVIQTRQSIDYAMQLSMSSAKMLRFCYKRQELFEPLLAQLISPIYNSEYDDSISITVKLPPPSFINMTNTTQLMDNTLNLVQKIVEIDLAGEESESLKNSYTRALFNHYIGTHIDVSAHQDILARCRIEANAKTDESHSSDNGMSDY